MLLIGLMAVQDIRRLHECRFLSVYSPHGTINVGHYVLGIVLYSTFSFAILCEAPDPAQDGVYFSLLLWIAEKKF